MISRYFMQFISPVSNSAFFCTASPPGKRDSLYLTEGGQEAFDQLYRLWEGQMRVVSSATPSPLLPLPEDSQGQLVSDLLNMLIGVASTSFPLNQVGITVHHLGGNRKSVTRMYRPFFCFVFFNKCTFLMQFLSIQSFIFFLSEIYGFG